MEIKIGNRIISEQTKPYFIADIAANHDGDLDRAYKLIELAKEAGADAAKFQNFKAQSIVSRDGFESMGKQISHQSEWKKSVFDTYADASIPDEWSGKLKEKCEEIGIEYMTSPYDFSSVDWAERFVNAYKIGSGDITWIEIVEHIAKKNKPILLATGASESVDVERAVRAIEKYNNKIILMQCNTNYTAAHENFRYINLRVLETYKEKYPEYILGLSDHTYGHTTVLGALSLGARVFEKHFTDDNDREGPDHKFSMNPATWREMVEASNDLFAALGDGVKKIEENERETSCLQRRAIYTRKDLKADSIITAEDIFPLRPAKIGSIYPYEAERIIGKKIKRDIKADTCLMWEDMSDV